MVEVDVQLSADGVLVAAHDGTLERLGGGALVLEGATAAEITGRPLAAGDGPEGRFVPTLENVLWHLPKGFPVNVELKRRSAPRRRVAEALARTLDGRGGVLVSSFDWELLGEVQSVDPELPVAPIGRERPRELLAAAVELEAWSVHCRRNLATAPFVAAAGRPVLAYTVNDAVEAKRLFGHGVQGVFTDHPGRLRDALDLEPGGEEE